MANALTAVIPQLLGMGLMILRERAIMTRLVNRGFDFAPGQKGSTVDVRISSAATVRDVVPANTPPDVDAIAPTTIPVTVDQWKESVFALTDKEILEIHDGVVPDQAKESVKALGNYVDRAILTKMRQRAYHFVGTPGTTPFATGVEEFVAGRILLNQSIAPDENRSMIMDPFAEGNAIQLRQFQDQSWRGDTAGIINGQIGYKFGAVWAMSQNVQTHTTGAAGTPLIDDAAVVIGEKVVHFDGFTVKPIAGDVFTVAGDTQTYVVQSSTTLVGTDSDVTFEPGALVAWADDAAVTFKASHVANIEFQKDAVVFASRPLEGSQLIEDDHFKVAFDEVTGLALRLELSRQHRRWQYAFDVLFGVAILRPEHIVRVAG